jgi:urease accessory protein
MDVTDPVHLRSWRARLALQYERRGEKTVLATRSHDGPLVVQKPLYPEGDAVCHTIIVHPPAGIAGGDELDLDIRLAASAQALLTTPGAGKWYRSGGPWARMRVALRVQEGACLEWLPQETIVFDGALADMAIDIDLEGDARYMGWDVICLGRTGSGERYTHGECRLSTRIRRDGKPLWLERGRIEGGGALMGSPVGLGGHSVFGTFAATILPTDAGLVAACRAVEPTAGDAAVTLLPGLLVARYLGDSSESARDYFEAVWRRVRPAVAQRDAATPRIWRT